MVGLKLAVHPFQVPWILLRRCHIECGTHSPVPQPVSTSVLLLPAGPSDLFFSVLSRHPFLPNICVLFGFFLLSLLFLPV